MTNLCILRIVTTITYTPVTEPQLAEYYASKGLDPESLEYGLILYRSGDRPLAPKLIDKPLDLLPRAPRLNFFGFRSCVGRSDHSLPSFWLASLTRA
jgi:hypothetical protein